MYSFIWVTWTNGHYDYIRYSFAALIWSVPSSVKWLFSCYEQLLAEESLAGIVLNYSDTDGKSKIEHQQRLPMSLGSPMTQMCTRLIFRACVLRGTSWSAVTRVLYHLSGVCAMDDRKLRRWVGKIRCSDIIIPCRERERDRESLAACLDTLYKIWMRNDGRERPNTHQIIHLYLLDEYIQVLDPLTWVLARFLCPRRCSRGISEGTTQHKGILFWIFVLFARTTKNSQLSVEWRQRKLVKVLAQESPWKHVWGLYSFLTLATVTSFLSAKEPDRLSQMGWHPTLHPKEMLQLDSWAVGSGLM